MNRFSESMAAQARTTWPSKMVLDCATRASSDKCGGEGGHSSTGNRNRIGRITCDYYRSVSERQSAFSISEVCWRADEATASVQLEHCSDRQPVSRGLGFHGRQPSATILFAVPTACLQYFGDDAPRGESVARQGGGRNLCAVVPSSGWHRAHPSLSGRLECLEAPRVPSSGVCFFEWADTLRQCFCAGSPCADPESSGATERQHVRRSYRHERCSDSHGSCSFDRDHPGH